MRNGFGDLGAPIAVGAVGAFCYVEWSVKAEEVKFTVNANCEIVADGKVMTDNLITMVNKELSMLPSTGSRGAMALPMIGLSMMFGGAIVVLSEKKKNCT